MNRLLDILCLGVFGLADTLPHKSTIGIRINARRWLPFGLADRLEGAVAAFVAEPEAEQVVERSEFLDALYGRWPAYFGTYWVEPAERVITTDRTNPEGKEFTVETG